MPPPPPWPLVAGFLPKLGHPIRWPFSRYQFAAPFRSGWIIVEVASCFFRSFFRAFVSGAVPVRLPVNLLP
jgi:hypothetical protein